MIYNSIFRHPPPSVGCTSPPHLFLPPRNSRFQCHGRKISDSRPLRHVFSCPVVILVSLLAFSYADGSDPPAAELKIDNHKKCPKWAARGECTNNPKYMMKECRLSCADGREERRKCDGVGDMSCPSPSSNYRIDADSRTYDGDDMLELMSWLIASGSRGAFLLLLGPGCLYAGGTGRTEQCDEMVRSWKEMGKASPVDLWTVHCEKENPRGNLCKRAMSGSPSNVSLVLRWTGGGEFTPISSEVPPEDKLYPALLAAATYGRSKEFEAATKKLVRKDVAEHAWARRAKADAEGHPPAPRLVRTNFMFVGTKSFMGLNNYKMEFRVSATLARATGRALCLDPFVDGMTFEGGGKVEVPPGAVYDLALLGGFVETVKPERCPGLDACTPAVSLCGRVPDVAYVDVRTSTEDFAESVSRYDVGPCMAVAGCWVSSKSPADLHWELWAFLRRPPPVAMVAKDWIRGLFGGDVPFVALHWRFEEFECPEGGFRVGECVLTMGGTVLLSKEDIVDAVLAAVAVAETKNVFLATDGRRRGHGELVDGLLHALLERRLVVRERADWHCDAACIARADGKDGRLVALLSVHDGHTFDSELDQQIVALSAFAIGSSRSSWFTEALFEKASREGDRRAFDVVLETEMALHRNSGEFHLKEGIPFPSVSGMEELQFGFLGQPVRCDGARKTKYDQEEKRLSMDGSIGICSV